MAQADAPVGATNLKVNVGICEIDSYDMLFYSHYPRYNERAANQCLTPAEITNGTPPCYAVLSQVHYLKYSRSVRWTDIVEIRTSLAGFPDSNSDTGDFSVLLLHEWFCSPPGGQQAPSLASTSLSEYVVTLTSNGSAPNADSLREIFMQRLAMVPEKRQKMLQVDSKVKFEVKESNYRQDDYQVYRDMLGVGGQVLPSAVMDIMERQRTELIGGQAMLETLKREDNILIVVYTLQKLRWGSAKASPWDKLVCRSGYAIRNGMYYCVHQQILVNGEIVMDGYLELVFVKDGAILKETPERIRPTIAS